MFYCNTCGTETLILEESHTLDKQGRRTGKILRTCKICHIDYHKKRKDYSRWGKLGVQARKKKGTYNMGMVSLGFKFVKKRRS